MKIRTKGIIQIIIVIAIFLTVLLFKEKLKELQQLGLLGIFVISLLCSATIILPAPGWVSVMAIGIALNPYQVGIAAGLGSGVGEMTGYLAGDGAAKIVIRDEKIRRRYYQRILKYDAFGVFLLAFIPNPLFDIAGIAAGSVKMPIPKFLAACITGRILRYVLLAYLGKFTFKFV